MVFAPSIDLSFWPSPLRPHRIRFEDGPLAGHHYWAEKPRSAILVQVYGEQHVVWQREGDPIPAVPPPERVTYMRVEWRSVEGGRPYTYRIR